MSFACFGIFPNVATLLILLACGATNYFAVKYDLLKFPGSKVLWVLLMGLIFIFLARSREKILATGRAKLASRTKLKIFLVLYYSFTYAAVLGSYVFCAMR